MSATAISPPEPGIVVRDRGSKRPSAVPDPAGGLVPRRDGGGAVRFGPWRIVERDVPEGSGLMVPFATWEPSRSSGGPEYLPQDWPAGWRRVHPLEALRRLALASNPQRLADLPGVAAPEAAPLFYAERRLVAALKAACPAIGPTWRHALAPLVARFDDHDWGTLGSLDTTEPPTEADRMTWPFLSDATRNLIALADGTGHVEGAYTIEWREAHVTRSIGVRLLRVLDPPRPLPRADGVEVALGAYLDESAGQYWSVT